MGLAKYITDFDKIENDIIPDIFSETTTVN